MISNAVRVDRFTLLLAAISAIGSGLLLLRMATYGVNLTRHDSELYISVARSLSDGMGFTDWSGYPYRDRAPLYPLILGFTSGFGIDAIEAAGYVNAAAFGATSFVLSVWLRNRVRSRFLVVWAVCACVLSIQMAEFSTRVATEIIFILFVVSSLFALDSFLSTGKRSLLLWAAATAAAAVLTRYIGVTLIGGGLLVILCARNHALRLRLTNATIYSIVAVVPFSLWVLRNILTVEVFLGKVYTGGLRLQISLYHLTSEPLLWVLGQTGVTVLNEQTRRFVGITITGYTMESIVIGGALMICIIVIVIGYALSRYRSGFLQRNSDILMVASLFVVSYALFLAIERPLNDGVLLRRYMIPIFVPLLVIVTVVLDEFVSLLQGLKRRLIYFSILTGWLLLQIGPNIDSIRQWNDTGRGYGSKKWQESEVWHNR